MSRTRGLFGAVTVAVVAVACQSLLDFGPASDDAASSDANDADGGVATDAAISDGNAGEDAPPAGECDGVLIVSGPYDGGTGAVGWQLPSSEPAGGVTPMADDEGYVFGVPAADAGARSAKLQFRVGALATKSLRWMRWRAELDMNGGPPPSSGEAFFLDIRAVDGTRTFSGVYAGWLPSDPTRARLCAAPTRLLQPPCSLAATTPAAVIGPSFVAFDLTVTRLPTKDVATLALADAPPLQLEGALFKAADLEVEAELHLSVGITSAQGSLPELTIGGRQFFVDVCHAP